MRYQYDVVICGGGAAGALCADRLKATEPSLRVLVLDAGDNELNAAARSSFVDAYQVAANKNVPSPYAGLAANHAAPSPDGTGDPFVMNRYYVEAGQDLFKSGYQRMLGGSTWAWRGNTPRMIPSDFRLKTLYGVAVDWPLSYDDIEPYYSEAERELGVSGNDDEWDGLLGAQRSAPFPMPGIVPSYGDKLVRAALAGLAVVDGTPITVVTTPQARNSKKYDGRSACQGNSSCIPICPSGAKYDAGAHLRKARNHGVEIRGGCVVTKLTAGANGRVHTVHFRDWTATDTGERQITTKFVVVALNAVETPKLWLLSGLDNRSDQVGRNLMDHLAEEVVGLFGEPLFPFRGPQSTLSIETFRDGPFRRATGAFRMTIGNDGWGRTEYPTKTVEKLMWDATNGKVKLFGKPLQEAIEERVTRMLRIGYSTEQLPAPDNRVTLSQQKDSFDIIRPKITFKIDDYSKRALAYGHSVARRIWQYLEETAGGEEVEPLEPLLSFNGAGHPMGTMRMGTDPATAVVDPDGRSHAHRNVYVIGTSVFPTGASANPTLTLAALTLLTSEAIIKALR